MKMKRVLALLVSLSLLVGMLCVMPLTTTAADNLAANGDLELGNTNSWEIDSAAIDSSVKYAGNYSLKLTATAAYAGAAYKPIPVRKNATITVSFYYRYASAPGSKLYHVYTYKGANPWTGTYSGADASFTAASSVSTWKKISYTFNSGDYDSIYLKFCPGGSGGTTCYIDNLVVTSQGGDETNVDPYLTSFGTKNNRPIKSENNLIQNGGFESATNAPWNISGFVGGDLSVVTDPTAPEGNKSLYFNRSQTDKGWFAFPVAVEKYTQYTFSAWVKTPRLSAQNNATATFGVVDPSTGKFLVYQPYNGNGHGAASLSTPTMQLMATAPDDQWHLRSVTFHSGSRTTVNIAVYGAKSRLYLDDIALFKSATGVEYISPRRSVTLSAGTNTGHKYCADEDSLIPAPHMSGAVAENHWSANPAWRNGFLSFADTEDNHGTALKYTASAHPEWRLHYIDWIDVVPGVNYTLTLDVKRLAAGGGRIALLDDNVLSPAEFYSISFSTTDSDWKTYSVTFNTEVYDRIGFAVVDGGGAAYIDKTRLFKTIDGISKEPIDESTPALRPTGGLTSVMEMSGGAAVPSLVVNGGFEEGCLDGWDVYQNTDRSADAAQAGLYGAHLKGDGSWGALLEQKNIPVKDGSTYRLTYWYKANNSGSNFTLFGDTTGTQYAYTWAANKEWTCIDVTFTVSGDTSLTFNLCGGGDGNAEDLYVDEVSLTEENTGTQLGVAFRMDLEATGLRMQGSHRCDYTTGTVDVYGDGTRYRLITMGAVMTNDPAVGTDRDALVLESVQGSKRTIDIPAVFLCGLTDTTASYAVRVINVPWSHRDTRIYARPYYIFEKDGQPITVYGDIYSRSYNSK